MCACVYARVRLCVHMCVPLLARWSGSVAGPLPVLTSNEVGFSVVALISMKSDTLDSLLVHWAGGVGWGGVEGRLVWGVYL